MILSTRRADAMKQQITLLHSRPFTAHIITQRMPLTPSMIGYCTEIFDLQLRHLPPNTNQLNTGTISYHFSFRPQVIQWEGAVTIDSPRGIRQMQTFRKLPMVIPNMKIIMQGVSSRKVSIGYFLSFCKFILSHYFLHFLVNMLL